MLTLTDGQIIHFIFGSFLPIMGWIILIFSVENYLPKIYNVVLWAALCVLVTFVTLTSFFDGSSIIKSLVFIVINLVALFRFFDVASDYRHDSKTKLKGGGE
jgi:fatty acid desaturase